MAPCLMAAGSWNRPKVKCTDGAQRDLYFNRDKNMEAITKDVGIKHISKALKELVGKDLQIDHKKVEVRIKQGDATHDLCSIHSFRTSVNGKEEETDLWVPYFYADLLKLGYDEQGVEEFHEIFPRSCTYAYNNLKRVGIMLASGKLCSEDDFSYEKHSPFDPTQDPEDDKGFWKEEGENADPQESAPRVSVAHSDAMADAKEGRNEKTTKNNERNETQYAHNESCAGLPDENGEAVRRDDDDKKRKTRRSTANMIKSLT